MSTSAYLNSPPSPFRFIDLKEDQHLQFYLLQNQAASSSLSSPILFNMPQDQFQNNQHKSEYNYMLHGGPSNCYQGIPSSSSAQQLIRDSEGGHEFSAYKLEDKSGNKRDRHDQPAKWMSSTMMVNIQEKITQNSNDQQQNNITTNTSFIRVCSDCNTTKTPLWRSGPQGPKSLCNACGIRQRKARRALAAAANGAALAAENATVRTKVQIKDKKPRTTLNRKPFKHPAASNPQQNGDHKVSFKDFALSLSKNSALPQETFPEDVEEAAVLLMALSCGLLHS